MSPSLAASTELSARRDRLVRRVRLLVAFTIGYNLIEAVVALAAGAAASSSALLGFGLDSLVEVSSAVAVAWQFSGRDHAVRESRERTALRVTACSFFALALFVSYHSVSGLLAGHASGHSRVGIVIAALSLVVMPVASLLQRRAGRQLGSHSAVADSQQTMLCTYMSAVLLLGLVANSLLGWWWADPAAALGIAALAAREGINAWRGEACCSPAEALFGQEGARCADQRGAGHRDAECAHEPRRILDLEQGPPGSRPQLPVRVVDRCACSEACSTC